MTFEKNHEAAYAALDQEIARLRGLGIDRERIRVTRTEDLAMDRPAKAPRWDYRTEVDGYRTFRVSVTLHTVEQAQLLSDAAIKDML